MTLLLLLISFGPSNRKSVSGEGGVGEGGSAWTAVGAARLEQK